MTTIAFSAGDLTIKAIASVDDFSLSLNDASYAQGVAGTSQQTINDITYNVTTSVAAVGVSDVVVNKPLAPTVDYTVSLSSETPATCIVDALGKVSRVADGDCRILASSRFTKRRIGYTISTLGGQTIYDSIAGYTTGYLRRYLYDQQVAALAGVTPGAATQRAGAYGNGIAAGLSASVQMSGSYGGVNSNNFIRAQGKANFAGFDLTLLDQVLDSDHAGSGVGWRAWISPHHFLTWRGHNATNGATWQAISGEIIVEYSATAWLGAVAKLLPADYALRLNILSQNWAIIGTGIACWARLYNTYDNKSDATAERRWVQPVEMHRCAFTDGREAYQVRAQNGTLINGGDSGSPIFCGISGDLVMVSHAQSQYNIGTMFYADYITQINAAMAALNASGTYTVQTVDLSGFTAYP